MTRLITFITSLFFFIAPAYANSNEVMLDMIEYIEENSKYEYNGERLPFIEIRSSDELCQKLYSREVYEQIKEDCSVAGLYDHNMNIIYIADQPGEYMVQEGFIEVVLFHELVHFLQYLNDEDEKVVCMQELEADAYLLQDDYVVDMGYPEEQRPNPLFAMIVSTCPKDHHMNAP